LSLARHALLDEVAAECRIDQSTLGASDRLAQGGIVDLLLAREPREILRS